MKDIKAKIITYIIYISLIQEFTTKTINSGTFSDLQDKLNEVFDTQLELEQDYIFNSEEDNTTGIIINKSLTIDGQHHEINGLNKSKIFIISNATVVLKNINFINGFSINVGGAIDLINSTLEIINCSFLYNSAEINGGAINLYNSIMNLTKCIFKFNKANGLYTNGGGIYSENSIINIEESNFMDNIADEGGAIYNMNSTLNIFNTDFSNNNANWYGGAILSDSQLTIYDSKFNNNNAGYKGGSIHTTQSEFSENSFLVINNTIMYNNSAEYGGAISSSNLQYVHIFNSEIYENNASFGSVISRLSGNEIKIINSSCYKNNAINGSILYSLAGGNNLFINDIFENNKADVGGLIYTLSGRISSQKTNYSSNFSNCHLLDNYGKKGLIYSIFDDLIITNSLITLKNKSYDVPIIYKIISGDVIEHNNWWGDANPDFDKLIIYEKENNFNNKNIINNIFSSEGCSSTIIQIDNNNSAFTFRRDSSEAVNVNIVFQKNGIIQFKSDPDFFWHGIITNDGWIVGNGGVDTPHSCEKYEAYVRIMIAKNKIIDELIDKVYKIKSILSLGHLFIKAPDGTYTLIINIINESKVRIEKGKLQPGEYIISPNDYKYYQKGKIKDLDIKENYTYISRYLAAIDPYASSSRTNDFTYNYITKDKSKYIDIFVSNDDGSLAKKQNNSHLYNDICINGKYILGEKVPIIMNGMYLDRYLIEDNNNHDNNQMINLKINIKLLLLILGLLLIN